MVSPVQIKKIAIVSSIISLGLSISLCAKAESVTVYAAASLTNAINDLEKIYEKQNKVEVKTSYAGSSTLAKQIEAGAPADVFISADTQWMDYLQNKKLVAANDRINLLGNQLVLITPKGRSLKIKLDKTTDPNKVFTGKMCTGDTKSVPVGKYAKQAFTNLGWWSRIEPKLVETEDVRAALNFVARGECQAGIVYATDAAISKDVKVAGVFPENTHSPIIYPVGLIKKNPSSAKFYQFLQSNQAKAVFKKYGFSVLAPVKP
ncbi:molybdate ABC transporter substrate-binding protein [Acinetobacter pittii]|uniref:molybdate ABC transporter substrate-binding protein n=1 Tax=Acinetobacter pittii TaxID=48296 RepID=UPI000A36150C|nr:molybdate ABC transporter substrate-binding protein [Acinetobacter pittii]MCZ1177554.1 molybdate ABC transporter substrate-binding protein [Acinetobacter pittii]OTU23367.1 molybdate ABC transporter substrate-binding protein [Acinetobacter pittii]OTU50850.1 molybdate ABC transporter substrate-binding protein [Acinetobacter pittii]QDB81840.1 molybdate ABC transporter substrate-binding protein [Acinetobacter pittii]QRF08271.1 molybdate ABC transporter substrate-binding protein [Acinetobacter p